MPEVGDLEVERLDDGVALLAVLRE